MLEDIDPLPVNVYTSYNTPLTVAVVIDGLPVVLIAGLLPRLSFRVFVPLIFALDTLVTLTVRSPRTP